MQQPTLQEEPVPVKRFISFRPIPQDWLEAELQVRDWNMGMLARKAKLNKATISRAWAGYPVTLNTRMKITRAFKENPA